MEIERFIRLAIEEDIQTGDHTSLACIPKNKTSKAEMIAKENGIVAGIEVAKKVFEIIDADLSVECFYDDGDKVEKGDLVLLVKGSAQSILQAERLALNFMQRMSGIATLTNKFVQALKGTNTKVLDTRKTTPLFRQFEKMAVKIGGGENHRFGLWDMIMIKDNHISFSGGIEPAITSVRDYLKKKKLDLRIEIETANLEQVQQVLDIGGVHRIMLDNFKISDMKKAVKLINKKYETEASGGITLENAKEYASTGVDYISVGALTHSYKSLDLSLKAI